MNEHRRFRLLGWLGWALIVLVVLALLGGCASGRWLSKEEDAAMRAACEPAGGCAVIPNPQWRLIEQLLRKLGAWTDT